MLGKSLSSCVLSGLILAAFPGLALAEAPLPCRPIAGLDEILKPGKILLLGEIHGTAESPAFVADLACHAARAGRQVTVALEINRSESLRVESYLASKGLPEDRATLVQGDFWSNQMRDGRSSEAMAGLVESLRKLRKQGASLNVELLDPGPGGYKDGPDRDRQMAANLAAAVERSPGDVFVSLTGNLHNRLVRGWPNNPDYEWLGYILRQKHAGRLVSLNASSTGGTAWVCFGEDDCGPQPMKGQGEAGDPRITLHPRDESGYDGTYFIGTLTASPPAVPAKEIGKP